VEGARSLVVLVPVPRVVHSCPFQEDRADLEDQAVQERYREVLVVQGQLPVVQNSRQDC
jgi:hypothetical protein